MSRKKAVEPDPNTVAFLAAWKKLAAHPMFAPLVDWRPLAGASARLVDEPGIGYAVVGPGGLIRANRGRRLGEDEWTWVLAHCLLHLGFGHHARAEWDDVACLVVTRFQRSVKLGREPFALPDALPSADEDQLRRNGLAPEFTGCGAGSPDLSYEPLGRHQADPQWTARFAAGLSAAATAAVDEAGGAPPGSRRTPWQRALSWFVGSYPLLGAIAARYKLVADASLARDWDISVAAVSPAAGEIYVNPLRQLGEDEWRFVLAHEMLHAALRHGDRAGWRDAYLWNVACDYVINGWLVEMAVGTLPDGTLYDPRFAGLSAEDVYDRIAGDLRRMRKLATLRGTGRGDILGDAGPRPRAVDLDEYCRRALLSGYAYHLSSGRGVLPSGLVAEIRVLEQPPLPWDVRLARWFDEHVPVPEWQRTYSRPSRRQASTPDIPRPGRHLPDEVVRKCTFGVVVDTSGSMNHELMGKALGAIASYATARDVPAARVVFCDAAAYDAGYLPVEEIAGRVRVRGRGGTALQPAIDLLERAEDFPAAGPILVITDGWCDVLRVRRPHAYLMPVGARLPFTPKGEVFRLTP
ncbi:vWA domain-containing protein [Paractinoplanes atraurantiacus]|uniref:Predicted metal-dependent peptidase n=1 Tax=Paractinoplanes atraurantiacus TaxID=1036182 RepID=A0A285I836_9ACTN|nr:hypothetical protein [Actinoplanes atraurantiacus]SNY44139.1 Predicted metal-dependent peptidase [Actinoplanes atraurantiacus]